MTKEQLNQTTGLEVVCEIPTEVDEKGDLIEADIFWVRANPPVQFMSALYPVQGKIYCPDKPNGRLVHWSPGFPGGDAGRAERMYAAALVSAGCMFSTHRFNGTSLVGPESDGVINCPSHIEVARALGRRHIGGTRPEGWPISSVVRLPATMLLALGQLADRIVTIGHSMGATANYQSLAWLSAHAPDVSAKWARTITLAGYFGTPGNGLDSIWPGMKMPMSELISYQLERVREKDVNFPLDEATFAQGMTEVAQMNKSLEIPPVVVQIRQFCEHDPLIHCPAPGEWMGPRSQRQMTIIDRRGERDPKAHSMLWITSTELKWLIRRAVPEGLTCKNID